MKKFPSRILLLTTLLTFLCACGGLTNAATAESPAADAQEEQETICKEIAATGNIVWQVKDGQVVCTEMLSGQTAATVPVTSLIPAGAGTDAALYRTNLVSLTEESAGLFAACRDAEDRISVFLLEMALDAEGITVQDTKDLTAALAPLYDPEGAYMQVDTAVCKGGVCVSALDPEFICHLMILDTERGEVTEIAQVPFASLTAVFPYGEDLLLAGDSPEEEGYITVSVLALPGGEVTPLAEFRTDSAAFGMNFCYDPAGRQMYFTVLNTAMRVPLEEGAKPERIAVLNGMPVISGAGVLAGGMYAVQTGDGELLSCDAGGSLTAAAVSILDLSGEDTLGEATALFNAQHPESFVTVTRLTEEDETFNPADYDGLILFLSSPTYRELLKMGYATDLSGEETLQAAAADMPAQTQKALQNGGELAAFPVMVETPCIILNTEGFTKLTGLSTEEIPRDWPSFLTELSRIAESGALRGQGEYTLTDAGMDAESFRQIVLLWILRAGLLDAAAHPEDLSFLRPALTEALTAFEQVDWTMLGLPETEEDAAGDGEGIPILSEMLFEISPMQMREGAAFWPMALRKGETPQIPAQMTVLMVNDASDHLALTREWASFLWQEADVLLRMSLCRSLNEPVINEAYEEDIAYLEALIQEDEAALAGAADEAEAEAIRQEMAEIAAYLEDYRENARWAASEETIAAYRAQAIVPEGIEFWLTEEGAEVLGNYLAGQMTAEDVAGYIETVAAEP